MGCSGSKQAGAALPAVAKAPPSPTMLTAPAPAPVKPSGKGSGKGRGGGKGRAKAGRFQIKLSGDFKDYEPEEDAVLKKAYLVGQKNCRFQLRGQSYEYSFQNMTQTNLGTKKVRDIRPPMNMPQPSAPLLPAGPMVVITVRKGQAGKEIEIDDPNNRGRKIKVNVPPGAKAGQKMAVPVPEVGESVAAVAEKQQKHGAAARLALGVGGVAAVGALAVGGVVLGDHLTGGHLGVADAAEGYAEDVADWAPGAAEDAGEWAAGAAEDAGEWATGAAEDVADWAEGAGEWAEGALEDSVDWLEGAADDVGDFVTSLF